MLNNNRYMFIKSLSRRLPENYAKIRKHLNKAIENAEFELYYQPQFTIDSKSITGFEALIRWNSPELGFVAPNEFIYIAEHTRLIIPIGKWVLKTACEFIKKLHKGRRKKVTISVNISIVQIMHDNFVRMVLDTLEEVDLNPEFLELEITESVLMDSYEGIHTKLKLLQDEGIKIAIDDFGKGYSSLCYLSRLPVNTIKMDKLFIDEILNSDNEQPIADLIIQLGRRLGMSVLAEGVETKEQLEYLKHHQCMKVQGFYLSKPLPQTEAAALIKKSHIEAV